MKRPATIEDVAFTAGVSRQTVSRAINDMPGINSGTKARVLAVARDLRYRPSRFGRGLATADHRMLGLVLDDLTNPYYPALAAAVTRSADRAGWRVLLTDTGHSGDPENVLAELSAQVDAVVGYLYLDHDTQDRLFAGMPVVEIDSARRRPLNGGIGLDLRPAMRDLVQHLIDHGVHRPLMVDRASPGKPSKRGLVFRSELARRGLAFDHAPVHTGSTAGDYTAIGVALDAHPDADAVLAYNDLYALGVLSALRNRDRQVPTDVRVIGIDGLDIGELMVPRLTTLALDMTEVGRLATELVMGMRAGELPLSGPAARRKVRHGLLLRDSA